MSFIPYEARIVADSTNAKGNRLTTMVVVFPRIVLAEFNTHRVFSRNSASSRAIPVEKMIAMVEEQPYVPEEWGSNQKGMQAGEPLNPTASRLARITWEGAAHDAVCSARRMIEIGVHKQLANRLLEPFLWHTVVVTATEWSNFFNLRCHPDAHPAIRKVAENMRMALVESTPKKLGEQDWHLPFIRDEDIDGNSVATLKKVSAGRCARVSYLTHEGKRDLEADVALHDRLLASGHLSPFEHQARPMDDREKAMGWFASNFQGWVQYRKTISYESDIKNPNNGQPIPTIHVG